MKLSRGLLLLVIVVYAFELFSQAAVCAYGYRKRIAFDPAMVSGASDLTNFPAVISITSDNDLRTIGNGGHVASASGFDIIFVAEDGITKLDHQLERFTAATGEFAAWVRIPTLSTSTVTYIYMYYGNAAIVADQSVNTTWNSNYTSVWHLNNNSFADGTASGNNATNGGSTNMAAAKIAGGRTFPGTNTNYIQAPLGGASGGNGNGTIALWGRVTTFEASTYFFGATTNQGGGYADRVQIYIGNGTGTLYLGLGGNHNLNTNVQALALNTWYHIVLTWANGGMNSGTYFIYVNGVQRGTGAYAAFSALHTFGDLGNDGNASQRTEEITGNMDEVHVMNNAASAAWIITEYNNQNSPSTFYSISAEPKTWTGGTSTDYDLAANWLGSVLPVSGNDVIINNGTFQPVLVTSQQANSVFVRTGATLALSTLNLSVRSDITNCGTITGNTGSIILNSAAANVQTQHLSGTGTYNLNNLTINNTFATSPRVTLNKDVNVSGALVLTSGIVNTTATNILALGTGATSTGGSATSFISGPMSKDGTTAIVFPLGKGTRWRRLGISGPTASSNFRAEYMNAAYTNTSPVNAPLDNISTLEYWQLDRLTGAGNASVTLYWEDAAGSGITNCPDLTIARWNGASWDERAATFNAGSSCAGAGTGNLITNAVVTAFSPFTFGSKTYGLNPLPVDLIEFKGLCEQDGIYLSWKTTTEINNERFILERSVDGTIWTELVQIEGAGTSSLPHDYFFKDVFSSKELLYYKLWQVDRGGTKKAHESIGVNCDSAEDRLWIFPNPSANELQINLDLSQDYRTAELKIIDELGRSCFEQVLNLTKGSSSLRVLHHLDPGSYAVIINSSQLNFSPKKIVVMR